MHRSDPLPAGAGSRRFCGRLPRQLQSRQRLACPSDIRKDSRTGL